jgi:hypothetical protein
MPDLTQRFDSVLAKAPRQIRNDDGIRGDSELNGIVLVIEAGDENPHSFSPLNASDFMRAISRPSAPAECAAHRVRASSNRR